LKGIAEGTYKTKHADLTKFVQNAGLGSLAGLARSLGSLKLDQIRPKRAFWVGEPSERASEQGAGLAQT